MLEHQLPLGMFEETRYGTQKFALAPGDRLFLVSDGVHQATPGGRTAYGEKGLATAIRSTRLQPAAEAVGTVMRGLHAYHERRAPRRRRRDRLPRLAGQWTEACHG